MDVCLQTECFHFGCQYIRRKQKACFKGSIFLAYLQVFQKNVIHHCGNLDIHNKKSCLENKVEDSPVHVFEKQNPWNIKSAEILVQHKQTKIVLIWARAFITDS